MTLSSSVVICAYTLDRWLDLTASAGSVLGGAHRPQQLVVVIDHNDELLERTRRHFSGHRCDVAVVVAANAHRRGLSGARNTGIELATEDLVAFLDDDAVADPRWLEQLLAPYDDPATLGVGGAARPVWPAAPPGTRPRLYPSAAPDARGELDWVVGCSYHGLPETAAPVRNLMGCNMSFRRSALESTTGFSEDLGRIGRTPLGCEETELCIRLRRIHGEATSIVFDPSALVSHRVSPDRVRWRYLLARCYGEGVSKAAVAVMVGSDAALAAERDYVRRILPRALRRELRRALSGHWHGVTGSTAILLGAGVTALGYLRGVVGRPANQPSEARPANQPSEARPAAAVTG